ncbi:MAG: chemotaxis protein CheA [Beijerinckiaceae bacterium]
MSLDEIRVTFFLECEEQLAELETGLVRLQSGERDPELINGIFRAVHSIKGGAGAFGLDELVGFAHKFETVLDEMRSGNVEPTADVVHVMLRSADMLADVVAAARDRRELGQDALAESQASLNGLLMRSDKAEAEEQVDFQPVLLDLELAPVIPDDETQEHRFTVDYKPNAQSLNRGNEPVLLLRALARLGTVSSTPFLTTKPLLQDFEFGHPYLWWRIQLTTSENEASVREVFDFVDGDIDLCITRDNKCEAATAPAADPAEQVVASKAAPIDDEVTNKFSPGPSEARRSVERTPGVSGSSEVAATIRVDLERIDRLINLVGEMVINQAMLSQNVSEAGLGESSAISAGLGSLEQLTRELQESVMAIRAQPVKTLFQRMSRIVREVGEATGKSVVLRTDGDATEVDRTVIERIADPLTHMIRNAVDHGIEKPEDRVAKGKPKQGVVQLSAGHRSGRILIEVSDDGAGIDRVAVRESAIRKGLISPDIQMTDSEIDNLLFLPGFSTAQSVSNISGRGVGMDVVKRSIQALGGRISIASQQGQGTTFTLTLPLTLAILDGMVVKVHDEMLVVPLTAIIETLRPKPTAIHQIGAKGLVLADRGAFVPTIDVGVELGFRESECDPLKSVALLVETEVGKRCALLCDTIVDQRQVVIKSLAANYKHVPGIAAATILGDGRVALIIDVDAFVARTSQRPTSVPVALAS